MAEKTIMKVYPNGDLETIDTPITQSGIAGNYSFTRNSITVPQIIKYPSYRNHFIERDSVSGYVLAASGEIGAANEHDRSSAFINVQGWDIATVRIRFINMNNSYDVWVGTYLYTIEGWYYSADAEASLPYRTGNYTWERKVVIPENIAFLRLSANYYDNPNVTVQISVERGDTADTGHALAIEDMASWAVDTGQPISIFPQGIVIKGDLLQTTTL